MDKIKAFFDSPANKTGMIVWAGTAAGEIAQYFAFHTVSPVALVAGLLIGALKIFLPDNSVTEVQLAKLLADGTIAFKTRTGASIAAVVTDAEGIVHSAITVPAGMTVVAKPPVATNGVAA